MERVAFLVEHSGLRIGCLLNPESFVMRRLAGIARRQAIGGPLTGAGLADDPLIYTGGGTTELTLDLLFDVSLAGSSVPATDVRALTAPLWELSENQLGDDGTMRPPLVRFVWGKSWNIPGIVASVSERLEQFDAGGAPRRSWLRMRFVRTHATTLDQPGRWAAPPRVPSTSPQVRPPVLPSPEDRMVQIVGSTAPTAEATGAGGSVFRLDELAYRFFGDASWWRFIALANNVADPLRLRAGTLLRIPASAEARTEEAP